MTTRNLRSALLGSAVGVGLLASGGQAHALSTEFGELKIFFDTTVSVGVQMKTRDARQAFLSEANGGNPDLREASPFAGTLAGGALAPFNSTGITGTAATTDAVPFNFDDSINTDDRFLNFGAGDLTSANIKANHDLQVTWRNFTLFARATEFYDAVLNSDSAYNRFGIDDNNKEEVGRDARLLDLYLSADFDVGSLPVNFRAGKQVISWGEGTFIFNGINVINPIDVSAFRRPGVEIKEGLIPVWALYGSVGLPFDLSLEAFYQLDWEPFQLDPAGTPFASSDVANANSSFGGNQGVGFYSGSIRNGFNLRDCTGAGPTQQLANNLSLATAGASIAGYNNLVGAGCSTASSQHFLTNLPTDGSAQGILLSGYAGERGDPSLLGTARGPDRQAKDEGQFGVALRWYSEDLNSTEFGFYYTKYHSRLPIAQVQAAGVSQVVTSVSGATSAQNQALPVAGCFGGGAPGVGPGRGLLGAGEFNDPTLRLGGHAANYFVADPNGSAAALAPTALAALAATPLGATPALLDDIAAVNQDLLTPGSVSVRTLAVINCGITAGVANINPGAGAVWLPAGTERLTNQQSLSTSLIYPEDIELWGMSFNTTIGDWGVQGEFTYRPNQPLQVDTDVQTITSVLYQQCVAVPVVGDVAAVQMNLATTEPGTPALSAAGACNPAATSTAAGQGFVPRAFVREEVFTAQIGTTATYTSSNPLIDFLGADIGVLVTEFGIVHIPGVPDEQGPGLGQDIFDRLSSVCRSGTDVPGAGLLSLDTRNGCRPTETSYGGILLTRLDYNNAFGTAWTLSPQLVYRHDLEGVTPAPLGNYVEDRRSLGFSVTANLQNTWTVGLSYTDFMGSERFQNDLDDDFVSLTASYSF